MTPSNKSQIEPELGITRFEFLVFMIWTESYTNSSGLALSRARPELSFSQIRAIRPLPSSESLGPD